MQEPTSSDFFIANEHADTVTPELSNSRHRCNIFEIMQPEQSTEHNCFRLAYLRMNSPFFYLVCAVRYRNDVEPQRGQVLFSKWLVAQSSHQRRLSLQQAQEGEPAGNFERSLENQHLLHF